MKVLITRPRRQSDTLAQALRQAGAEPILFPVIEIAPAEDNTALDRALNILTCYDWLVLTSVNGVEAVWNRMEALGLGSLPAELRVAAIGPKTAGAVRQRGTEPQYVPGEYVAEAILPGLGDLRGRWVLLPRADLARPDLARLIEQSGGVAHEIAAYRTLPASPTPEGLEALRQGVDIVAFTSSSTVRNFAALARAAGMDPLDLPGRPRILCIGPITAATANQEGFAVDAVAEEYTAEGLLKIILDKEIREARIERRDSFIRE
jgi:uroporphyrinogen-III synthase